MLSSIITTAFYCTSCKSEARGEPGTPRTLPLELLDEVIQYALSYMEVTKDGTAVVRLLHTSRITRLKCVRAFQPIRLLEVHPPDPREGHQLRVPREFERFLWQALHWHLCRDFSQQPLSASPSDTAAVPTELLGVVGAPVIGDWRELLTTVLGEIHTHITVDLDLTAHAHTPPLRRDKRVNRIFRIFTARIGYNKGERRVNVKDGCEAAAMAIADAVAMRWAKQNRTLPAAGWDQTKEKDWIRCVNPVYRALHGSLGPPASGAQIMISCWMHTKGPNYTPTDEEANRYWLFEVETAQKEA